MIAVAVVVDGQLYFYKLIAMNLKNDEYTKTYRSEKASSSYLIWFLRCVHLSFRFALLLFFVVFLFFPFIIYI